MRSRSQTAATAPRLLAAEGTWGGQEIKMLKKLLSGNLRFSMQEEAGAREQKGPGEGAEGLKELLGEGEQARSANGGPERRL